MSRKLPRWTPFRGSRAGGPRWSGVLAGALACAAALEGLWPAGVGEVGAQPGAAPVRSMRIDGPITIVTADYLRRAVLEAAESSAPALVVELNTPGGESGAMQRIAGDLLNAPLPTIVWVGPEGAQAASAGTFLVLAAHAAGMAPRTVVGAASPVGPSGEDLPETLGRKAVEDFSAAVRSYAERRGPAAEAWAERAVRDAASATADEALELGVIDAVAGSPAELLAALDGTTVELPGGPAVLEVAGAEIVPIPMSRAESWLARLAHPAVAILLLTLGVNALFIELSHPGGHVAGAVGVVALALALYTLGVLEANLVGLAFMGVAFVLFILEANAPTHGALATAGVAAFIFGGVLLFSQGPFPVPWGMLLTLGLASAAFAAVVISAGVRAARRPPATGAEGLIGARGTVRRRLEPAGVVFVQGALWDATSEAGTLEVGGAVTVVGRDGHTLVVRPL